jgi:uncharacterized membrane protein YdjX (TVP38/TMEM64 family)
MRGKEMTGISGRIFMMFERRSITLILYPKVDHVNLRRSVQPEVMRSSRKKLLLFTLLIVAAAAVWLSGGADYLTFENLKEDRALLQTYVSHHYALSVAVFMAVYVTTALFVPGALVMSLAGGFLFGVVQGTLYVIAGASVGATLAFLSARYLLGDRVQRRFGEQLGRFNREMKRHGHNYLLVMRIFPLLPFFVTNYLAGITRIRYRTFLWTTCLGMLPGSVVYTFAGQEIGAIETPEDIFSAKLLAAFSFLAVLAILPVLHRIVRK